MGAEVIRGSVRYPSDTGDFAVGGVDIGEYLYGPKGQEVMLVPAALGPVEDVFRFWPVWNAVHWR